MLLRRLKEYADQRLQLPPRLYSEAPVRYIIEIDTAGRPLNPRPTDTADRSNRRTARGTPRLVPQIQRTSGIKPLLLVDTGEYVLGLPRPSSSPQRVAACHRAFVELAERCAAATAEPAARAVVGFLRHHGAASLELGEDFDPGSTMTFRVHHGTEAVFPTDLPAIQEFWAAEHDPASRDAPILQCLTCGLERPVLKRLEAKIKGIPGGQASGTAIISANAEAFTSYGLEASLIAPTCAACGERFTRAANALLADEASSLRFPNAVFIFWTREPVRFSFRELLNNPRPELVRDFLASVWSGERRAELEANAFYGTVLSASGGRAVVRQWMDITVAEACRQLTRWFAAQQIVGRNGEPPQPLGLYALASGTVREADEIAPNTLEALLRSALTGVPLPSSLLFQAVRRNRAEQGVTTQRATLIKLVLRSQASPQEEDRMVQLDPDHPSPAYQCGRLLAVLEQVQRLAVPGVKATIVDRFFGTASSAPASVFGRLVRGAQPHLAKLERDRPGAYQALQQRLEQIQGKLSSYPRTLSLTEQGLFALGYYHQRAADRAQARAAAERRQAGAAAPEAELAQSFESAEEEREDDRTVL